MPDINYQNVYNFSTNLTRGFNATIACLDGDQLPLPVQSATMILTRRADGLQEFVWTSSNNLISILANGQLIINVAQANMTPQQWIVAAERYPYQLYDYVLRVMDAQPALLFSIAGSFTIFEF
jgi:hypothetical protein